MNVEEKIEAAKKKRREGFALYIAKEYARAFKRLEQVTKVTLIYFTLIHSTSM
jgi:hypothetical protein